MIALTQAFQILTASILLGALFYAVVFVCVVLTTFKVFDLSKLLQEVLNEIKKLNSVLTTPIRAERVLFYTTINGKNERISQMFLKVSQALPISVMFADKNLNPAMVDGAPKWAVTSPELANLSIAEDGMSATLTPVGPMGSFKVQVLADADLGEGMKEIVGELDIELIAGEAVTVQLTAGAPVDIVV